MSIGKVTKFKSLKALIQRPRGAGFVYAGGVDTGCWVGRKRMLVGIFIEGEDRYA